MRPDHAAGGPRGGAVSAQLATRAQPLRPCMRPALAATPPQASRLPSREASGNLPYAYAAQPALRADLQASPRPGCCTRACRLPQALLPMAGLLLGPCCWGLAEAGTEPASAGHTGLRSSSASLQSAPHLTCLPAELSRPAQPAIQAAGPWQAAHAGRAAAARAGTGAAAAGPAPSAPRGVAARAVRAGPRVPPSQAPHRTSTEQRHEECGACGDAGSRRCPATHECQVSTNPWLRPASSACRAGCPAAGRSSAVLTVWLAGLQQEAPARQRAPGQT